MSGWTRITLLLREGQNRGSAILGWDLQPDANGRSRSVPPRNSLKRIPALPEKEGVFAILAAALLALSAPAAAQETASPETRFEQARTAYQDGRYTAAQVAASAAALEGHAEAMTMLGYMHEKGLAGEPDAAQALQWYRKAAEQDEPEALMSLARFAESALYGMTPDQARPYLERALAAGRADAGVQLAILNLEGIGGPRDRARASKLLENAAANGGPAAAYQAGIVLSDGQYSEPDDATAATYFKRAAEGGHAAAATLYAHALYEGAGIAQDRPQAADWYAKAARRGDPEGQVYHALMLAMVDADLENAAYWLERSRLVEDSSDAVMSYAPVRAKLDKALAGELTGEQRDAAERRAKDDTGA